MNECVGLDSCAAKNATASLCPTDWQFYRSRALRSIAICSNTVKIKSPSYKILFILKLLKSIRHFEKTKYEATYEHGLNPLLFALQTLKIKSMLKTEDG
jgi:hypothetical protein